MDATALETLEFPAIRDRVAGATSTEAGAGLAHALAPSGDPEEVMRRQALTAEAIALLDESTPVVCVTTDSPILDKMLSNVEEVRARGADVIAIATEGTSRVHEISDLVIEVPRTDWLLQPMVAIIPLQLLAYHVARMRGLNVDQPRNLAKTVTVE